MSFLIKLLNNTAARDSNYGNFAECAARTLGQTSEWYITEGRSQLITNSDVGRANTARFDFGIRLGMGSCGHDTSHQFGERLLVHVEEHGANGWMDYVLSCGSHTGYMLQDMCRGSFLPESSSTNSSDE